MTALIRSPLARRMLEVVLAEPILLSPDERYLHGHYLAYLMSGSRRRGLFMRRPLEPRNADRGRLLLGVTYAILAGADEDAIRDVATLLNTRIEVRPILSPIVVAKYLSCRESPAKRKLFRQTRKAIAQASTYAQKHMIDSKGVLNPGLMPQKLDDLTLIAPARDEVDDVLVERWNRVAEVWRNKVDFRAAVLRYATANAHRDPASAALWPEVVYPLIERARWHRRIRTRTEAVWDYLSGRLHVADAGVVLDRALNRSVPAPLVAELDNELNIFDENPRLTLIPRPASLHLPMVSFAGRIIEELINQLRCGCDFSDAKWRFPHAFQRQRECPHMGNLSRHEKLQGILGTGITAEIDQAFIHDLGASFRGDIAAQIYV